jgi:hypothetical protein
MLIYRHMYSIIIKPFNFDKCILPDRWTNVVALFLIYYKSHRRTKYAFALMWRRGKYNTFGKSHTVGKCPHITTLPKHSTPLTRESVSCNCHFHMSIPYKNAIPFVRQRNQSRLTDSAVIAECWPPIPLPDAITNTTHLCRNQSPTFVTGRGWTGTIGKIPCEATRSLTRHEVPHFV